METRTRAESAAGEPLGFSWSSTASHEPEQAAVEKTAVPVRENEQDVSGKETGAVASNGVMEYSSADQGAPLAEEVGYGVPESLAVPKEKVVSQEEVHEQPPKRPLVADLPPLPETVKDTLRFYRERAGLAITEVAQKLNVHTAYLEALEKGDYSNVTDAFYVERHLRRICRILAIPEDVSAQLVALLKKEIHAATMSRGGHGGEIFGPGFDDQSGTSPGVGAWLLKKLPSFIIGAIIILVLGLIVVAGVMPLMNKYLDKKAPKLEVAPLLVPASHEAPAPMVAPVPR